MKLNRTIGSLLMILLIADSASACIVRYKDPAELKAEASLVVQAEVLSKEVTGQSQQGELYSYKVQMKATERGILGEGAPTTVTYYNLRARREPNGMIDCPIKDGSGKETDLQVGGIYRLFLKSSNETEILFSEKL